jgi:UDP-N-acetylmuramoyl-tripeptide--D-alanyl-D-alanine ligase
MTLWLILFLYFLEFLKFLYDFSKKQILKPIFTPKIISLFLFSFLFTLFYLFAFFQNKEFLVFWLLVFDILSPAIFSGIVLIFQPVTFLLRSFVIQKAKEKREKFKDLLVIGICGSYGKTSTKEFLATILEEKFPGKVLKTKEHQNSEVGISKCVLEDLKENHKIFVVEMGAYNKGGIKLLCNIVKPKIGIITGLNEQHLATFGSMENLISAEGGKELIESFARRWFSNLQWRERNFEKNLSRNKR